MLTILLLTLALAAATQARDVADAVVVRIDAVASDARGRVVEDLRPEDFEIREDGVSRTIDGLRFVRAGVGVAAPELNPITSRADEQAAAAEDGARLFAIFMDEYHVSPGPAAGLAREAMLRFVREAIGPQDLVLVVKPLESLLNLRLTRDRAAVLRTIESFEGRKGDYSPANAFERELIAGTPQRIEAARAQIATSALNALVTHLAGLGSARKTMIFVSEGFAGGPRRRVDQALPALDTVIRTARRASIAVQSFDPTRTVDTGSSSSEPSAAREMLTALAQQTDGRTIFDDENAAATLIRLAGEQRAYYLITFQSAAVAADGRFHPVEVRVRRPNVTVAARKGYWAPTADDVLRARLLAKASEPKPPPEPARRISPLIRPWFGMARGASGSTQVSFVWEPAGRVPGERGRLSEPAKIALKASKSDGTMLFEGVIRAAGGILAESEPVAGSMRAVFEAAPGRVRLQMRIEDASARLLDTDVRDLIVGPLSAPVTFGTAAVIRARNAREYRALAGNAAALPTSAREFSRTERLLIRVPAYAPDELSVSASLASRNGAAMRGLEVTAGPGPNLYQIDLPLAGIASGSYIVQLSARSPAGQARDEIAFRVTP